MEREPQGQPKAVAKRIFSKTTSPSVPLFPKATTRAALTKMAPPPPPAPHKDGAGRADVAKPGRAGGECMRGAGGIGTMGRRREGLSVAREVRRYEAIWDDRRRHEAIWGGGAPAGWERQRSEGMSLCSCA